MEIGKKIRILRKAKKMTLKQLSEASGVAVATLSRVETGRMAGRVKSHQAIASVLGLSLPQLYGDIELETKPVDFQAQENRSDLFVHNDKASYDMLTTKVLSKKMMPVMLKIAPGGKTSAEELPKQAERFIYVLKGKCKAYVGGEDYTLKEAETLYFNASLKHYFENIGDVELRAISVITPPAL